MNDFQIDSLYSTHFINNWFSFLLIWHFKIFSIWYFSCLFTIINNNNWQLKTLDLSWICSRWMIKTIRWIFQLAESFSLYIRLLIFYLIKNDFSLNKNNFNELKIWYFFLSDSDHITLMKTWFLNSKKIWYWSNIMIIWVWTRFMIFNIVWQSWMQSWKKSSLSFDWITNWRINHDLILYRNSNKNTFKIDESIVFM